MMFSVASVSLYVCLSVAALKGKRLELSTPNLVEIIVHGRRYGQNVERKGNGSKTDIHYSI